MRHNECPECRAPILTEIRQGYDSNPVILIYPPPFSYGKTTKCSNCDWTQSLQGKVIE